MGWKGVGVGEGLGAEVTSRKAGACEATGALVPHPARRSAAMMESRQMGFIGKGLKMGRG
jgi:hypothetical protein